MALELVRNMLIIVYAYVTQTLNCMHCDISSVTFCSELEHMMHAMAAVEEDKQQIATASAELQRNLEVTFRILGFGNPQG